MRRVVVRDAFGQFGVHRLCPDVLGGEGLQVTILRPVTHDNGSLYGYSWWCPGCDESHHVPTTGPKAWSFDGNLDAPTFGPSVKITWRGTDYPTADHPGIPVETVCHSIITGGRIQFCGDCTHALANQTVPMVVFPEPRS
jgi:hypothetical protein